MPVIETLDGVPDGYRVTIHLDEGAESPRDMTDDPIHVLTVPDTYYINVDKDPGPWGSHWSRLLERHRWSTAIELIERYARTVGAYTYDHSPVQGARSVWYLTREDAADWTDPGAALESYAKEYEAWANGEVYGYVIERRVTWQRADDADKTMDTWEHVESVWGFYGPGTEYVEQEARSALEGVMAEHAAQ